ncbi:MAG: GGDEF domain-containing protein [Betaproteobacteria bacterium]|nr:GGDEF domain-containing protein [Betaproteobacteria bacterium]
MTRAQTVVLALLLMHYLLGILCLLVARGERRAPSLRYWGWSLLLYSTGLLITLQRVIPAPYSLTLGNTLIAWAPIFAAAGVMANTPGHVAMRWAYGGLGATIAVLIGFNFFADEWRTLANLTAPSVIAIVLFVYSAAWLLLRPPVQAKGAAHFMAAFMLIAVGVWLLRIAFVWNIARVTNDRDSVDLIISLFGIAQIVIAVACTMALFWIEVRKMEMTLTHVALTDSLTELPNRRAVLERFKETESQAVRHGSSFALLILDIDHFKQFNDRYGHATGDRVLKHVADCLSRARRAGDFLGRIGGEEFVMLLNGDRQTAINAADRLRTQVQEGALAITDDVLSVTVSGGLAMFPADGVDWDQLFAVADRRLYKAKQDGRNRVVA